MEIRQIFICRFRCSHICFLLRVHPAFRPDGKWPRCIGPIANRLALDLFQKFTLNFLLFLVIQHLRRFPGRLPLFHKRRLIICFRPQHSCMECRNSLDIRHQFRSIFYGRNSGKYGIAAQRIILFAIRQFRRVCHCQRLLLLPYRFPYWNFLLCGRLLRTVNIARRFLHRRHFRLRRFIHGFYVRSFCSGPFHPGFLLPDPCLRSLLRRICRLFHLFSDAFCKCLRLFSGTFRKCLKLLPGHFILLFTFLCILFIFYRELFFDFFYRLFNLRLLRRFFSFFCFGKCVGKFHLCSVGHCILPDRRVRPPCIFHIMDCQSVALVHGNSGVFHIAYRNDRTKFPGTSADKNISQQNFFFTGQQIDTDIIAAHINLFHIHRNLTLAAPRLYFREPNVFSFDSAFIGIDI